MRSTQAKCIQVLAMLVVLLTVTGTAGSTTLLRLGLEEMSRDAVMVVQGHVAWDYAIEDESRGTIYSVTGVEVSRCIAGTCPETVVLRHRGGTAGGVTLYIPGMPRFVPGQEVLLFLEGDYEGKEGTYSVLGMVQGLFHVLTEPVSGKKLAVQQLGGVTMAAPDQEGNIAPIGPVAPVILEVQDLVQEVLDARKKKGGAQ